MQLLRYCKLNPQFMYILHEWNSWWSFPIRVGSIFYNPLILPRKCSFHPTFDQKFHIRSHSQEILFPLKSHCWNKAENSWQHPVRSYSVTPCVTPSGSLTVKGCGGCAARCLLQGSPQAAPRQRCILNATTDRCLMDLPQTLHIHWLREVQECFMALPLRIQAKDKRSFCKRKM